MCQFVIDTVIGAAVGDAVGVPYEFLSRTDMKKYPAIDMIGYGSHNQPLGTWSDDTSMILATMDALSNGLNYDNVMKNFSLWSYYGEFTPHGKVFDIGKTTHYAIQRYELQKIEPLLCGESDKYSNGNGSLMRILPFVLYCVIKLGITELCDLSADIVHNGSALTHSHNISKIACGIYASVVFELIKKCSKNAVHIGIQKANEYYSKFDAFKDDLKHFNRCFTMGIYNYSEEVIKSSGYVVDTLEAALWCVLESDSYKKSILKAVNLGGDTDTIACITGGISGLLYGVNDIPYAWTNNLIKNEYILDLCNHFMSE